MEFHPLRDQSSGNSSSIPDNNNKSPSTCNGTSPTPSDSSSICKSSPVTPLQPITIIRDCPDSIRHGHHNAYKKAQANPFPPIVQQNSLVDFQLTPEQIAEFHNTGILVVKSEQIWHNDELKLLLESVNSMDNWADAPGKYMKYYEDSKIDNSKILARIENFTQYNPGLNYICNGHKLIHSCSQLLGEASVLYKEKINYKLPGGHGFVPHQDVAAGWWMYGQSIHISVLVCVDPATVENGCLEVAFSEHNKGMLSEPWTELSAEAASKLKFVPVPTKPGDVIFFDSFAPHQSAPNFTNKSRRVLYATYAKAAEGDFRDRYYADKRASFPPDCERDPTKKYQYKV